MDFELDRNGHCAEKKVYHKKFHFGSVQAKEIKKGRCIQLNDWGLGLLSFAIFVLQTWLRQQV